jgi:hypothetical protein
LLPNHLISKDNLAKWGKDEFLILSASWEKRCLGIVKYSTNYKCNKILMTVYDGHNEERLKNINSLENALKHCGEILKIDALHENPIANVRKTIDIIMKNKKFPPKISIDISCYTRKHLLQLMQGLDSYGLLSNTNFFYTEPEDYLTIDNEPYAKGISSIKVIKTFAGHNFSSKDRILIIFLGYEGNRALALWEHLTHNITLVIIPDPPYKQNWAGRTEIQNSYLLSTLSENQIFKTHSLDPNSTESFMMSLFKRKEYSINKYNFFIAPLGTKAQTLGLYKYYRKNKDKFSIVYASPIKYKYERAVYEPGRTFLIDNSAKWND